MQILPIIMDTSFNKLCTLDTYTSFIWTSRYNTCGDFEIAIEVSSKNIQYLRKGYYVLREDDENVGIIEDIQISHTEEGADTMIVSGRFLSSILGRRIIATQTTVNGTLSDSIYKLLNENIINPSIASRKIANFKRGDYAIATRLQAQYTGDNLLETISKLATTYGFGYKVTLNKSNQFVFQLYEGLDRTYNQSANKRVVFSDEYDNLIASRYEENYKNIVSAVLVAGEGEGLDRRTLWVNTDATGLDRYEDYKDQRQLQSDDGQITPEEYNKLLKEAGEESLTTYTTAFTGKAYFGDVKYKTDVNLGDIVVINNSKWGISVNSRIVEVIESVNEAGEYSILPTFGM